MHFNINFLKDPSMSLYENNQKEITAITSVIETYVEGGRQGDGSIMKQRTYRTGAGAAKPREASRAESYRPVKRNVRRLWS